MADVKKEKKFVRISGFLLNSLKNTIEKKRTSIFIRNSQEMTKTVFYSNKKSK